MHLTAIPLASLLPGVQFCCLVCSRILSLEQYIHHVVCATHNNKVAGRLRVLMQPVAKPQGAKQQGAKSPVAKQPSPKQPASNSKQPDAKRQRKDGPG